jgi:hypothetical protein
MSLSWSQEKKAFPFYLELSPPVLVNEDGLFDAYDTNTTYFEKGKSLGLTESNELTYQSYAIGWQFPREKGKIILTYHSFEEKSSDTLIDHLSFDGDTSAFIIDDYFDPNLDEEFFDGPSNYILKKIDTNLGMETTLYDIAFWKDFAKGKRFSGSWNAGFRYAQHDQNVPIGYFITFENPVDILITDNFAGDIFLVEEECKSYGPKGGGIIHFYLFNKRLILSAGADVSLTFGETEVPQQRLPIAISYDFEYDPVNDIWNTILIFPEDLGLAPYTIAEKEDKSYWFTILDFNVKVRIFKELYAFVGYRFSDFRNVWLAPSFINPPTSKDQPPSGLFFSYTFEDISYETPYFGISVQF